MLVMWTPRCTDRPAINLRRLNANKEDAVEPPVPSAERLVVLLRIHGTATIRCVLVAVSPFSDMKIFGAMGEKGGESQHSYWAFHRMGPMKQTDP
jgi:hypothetical protein